MYRVKMTAGEFAEAICDVIVRNSEAVQKAGGKVALTIDARLLEKGIYAFVESHADRTELVGLEGVKRKAESELAKTEELLVENEYGRWQRMRFEAAKEFMVRDLEHPNMALSFEQMGQRARQAADELLKALGIESPVVEP